MSTWTNLVVVPNGGYVASVFQRVAEAHLAPRGHPDTLIAHWEFLGRTIAGPAVLKVSEIKGGRSMSVLHISLYQSGLVPEFPWISASSKSEVNAYITNGDISKEQGISLPTGWDVPVPPPTPDFTALDKNQDGHWKRTIIPIMHRVPSIHNVEVYTLRSRPSELPKGANDYWIRLANGEKFVLSDLGYVVDCLAPVVVESYRPEDDRQPAPQDTIPFSALFWYPTLVLNLDVKKKMAPEGEEWLRLRIAAKQILRGRFDIEFLVFDARGEYVAGSHHVALAVGSEKNTAGREKPKHKF